MPSHSGSFHRLRCICTTAVNPGQKGDFQYDKISLPVQFNVIIKDNNVQPISSPLKYITSHHNTFFEWKNEYLVTRYANAQSLNLTNTMQSTVAGHACQHMVSHWVNDLGLIFQTIKSCTRQNVWMDMLQLPKSPNLPLKVLSNAGTLSFMCSNYVISAYEKGHRASCKQFLIQLQLAFQKSWLQNSLFVSWHTVPNMPQVTNICIIPSTLHFYHYPNSFRIRVLYLL